MEDKFDKISRYLEEELSETERKDLEAAIADDPALQAELTLQQELQGGIIESGRRDLKARLAHIAVEESKEEKPKKPTAKFRRLGFRYAAAAVGLLVLSLAIYFVVNSSTSPQALYADNFQAYPADLTSRGGNSEADLLAALSPYQAGDYAAAVPVLDRYLQTNPGEAELRLILANAQLSNGQISDARENLEIVARNPLLRDQANWYLALSYLKEDNADTARAYLTKVASSASGSLAEKASDLLDRLP